MAIVSFWSSRKKETNQSISAISSALQMGIDRNLKILLIDTAFADDTYDKCFNQEENNEFVKNLNRGKLDISSGVEGLILAVTSNKSSPEIIQNYTQPILKGRLDLLAGMATKNKDQYRAGYVNYPDIVEMANKYYDLVIVDLAKGYGDKVVTKILAMSDIIVVTFDQDKELIYDFEKLWGKDPLFSPKERVIPLLTKEDRFSIYNNNNVARRIKMSPGMPSIIYNTQLMEAVQIGEAARFFINLNIASDTSRNKLFLDVVADLNMLLIDRIQQQKYKGAFNKNSVDETIRDHIKYMNKERQIKKEEIEKVEEEIQNQMQNASALQDTNQNLNNNVNKDETNNIINNETNNTNIDLNSNSYANADINANINTNTNNLNLNQENNQENNIKNEEVQGLNQEQNKIDEMQQNQSQTQNMDQNLDQNLDLSLNPNEKENAKEEKGFLGFFKNIFGNKNKENNSELNQNNLTDQNLNKNINENQDQNTNRNQNENQNQNAENNLKQENIINNLDEMSIEGARNITNQLNQQNNSNINDLEDNQVGEALSEAEKIMLENKKMLKKLEEESKLNEEKNKVTSLDFSGIKPLKQEGINKTDLYNIDDDGKINYEEENALLDKNLNEVEEKIERDKPKKAIDFSKIKPLSAEKDEIEMKKHQEIQEKIKSKLIQEENAQHGVMTQTQRAEMLEKQMNAENLNENIVTENTQNENEQNVENQFKQENQEEIKNTENVQENNNQNQEIKEENKEETKEETEDKEEITENKKDDEPMFNPILGIGLNDEDSNEEENHEENKTENNIAKNNENNNNNTENNKTKKNNEDSIDDLL